MFTMTKRHSPLCREEGLQRVVCLLLSAVMFALASCARTAPHHDLVIVNANIIDPVEGLIENRTIVIDDGFITEILEAGSGPRYAGSAETYRDAGGAYIIPGLWDAHVHLAFDPELGPGIFFPLAVANGVLFLRDTGGPLEQVMSARRAAALSPAAPEVYVAGPLIDTSPPIYDGHSSDYPPIGAGVSTPEQAASLIDHLGDEGVDFVKLYEGLPEPVFDAAIDAAHAIGLKASIHPPMGMTATEAVLAGADEIQHLRNLEFECSDDPAGLLQDRLDQLAQAPDAPLSAIRTKIRRQQKAYALDHPDEDNCRAIIALLSEHQVYQTPTQNLMMLASGNAQIDTVRLMEIEALPRGLGARWKSRAETLRTMMSGVPSDETFQTWSFRFLSALNDAHVPIMAGTDAPIGLQVPGYSLHAELEALVEAGLPPLDVIRSATLTPAEFFGMEAQQGRVQAGMKASLVALSGNPLDDIANTRQVEFVVNHGLLIERSALDGLLLGVSES